MKAFVWERNLHQFFWNLKVKKLRCFRNILMWVEKILCIVFRYSAKNFGFLPTFYWRVGIIVFDKSKINFSGTCFFLKKQFFCQFRFLRHLFRLLLETLPAILSKLVSTSLESHFEEHLFRKEKQLFSSFSAIEWKFLGLFVETLWMRLSKLHSTCRKKTI